MAGVTSATVPAGEHECPSRQLGPQALGDHIDRLYRAAMGLCGSRDEAEDLVQEMFARVLRRPRILRSPDDLGYLLRALRNTFIFKRRAPARHPQAVARPDSLDQLQDPGGVRPEAWVEATELYAVIAELQPDLRDAVVAVDLAGLSYREAARVLHIREATITRRLFRARRGIARALSEQIPGPPGPPAGDRRPPGLSNIRQRTLDQGEQRWLR
jgi:RNA polymerase sigma-70 factor (ECF subfamily)